jgi:hypothetical protein
MYFGDRTAAYLARRREELTCEGSNVPGINVIDKASSALRLESTGHELAADDMLLSGSELHCLDELCPDISLKLELDEWLRSDPPPCIPESIFHAAAEEKLDSAERAAFYRHISVCGECTINGQMFFEKQKWQAWISEGKITTPHDPVIAELEPQPGDDDSDIRLTC